VAVKPGANFPFPNRSFQDVFQDPIHSQMRVPAGHPRHELAKKPAISVWPYCIKNQQAKIRIFTSWIIARYECFNSTDDVLVPLRAHLKKKIIIWLAVAII
jgi:hypothetical protein